jgi:hypothetical protein
MGAFTSVTTLSNELSAHGRRAIVTAVCPASYDAGGSTIDLSAITGGGFTKVYGAQLIGQATAASDRYQPTYITAASYAAATGKLKIRDINATDGAAEASGDLSAVTLLLEVIGV